MGRLAHHIRIVFKRSENRSDWCAVTRVRRVAKKYRCCKIEHLKRNRRAEAACSEQLRARLNLLVIHPTRAEKGEDNLDLTRCSWGNYRRLLRNLFACRPRSALLCFGPVECDSASGQCWRRALECNACAKVRVRCWAGRLCLARNYGVRTAGGKMAEMARFVRAIGGGLAEMALDDRAFGGEMAEMALPV